MINLYGIPFNNAQWFDGHVSYAPFGYNPNVTQGASRINKGNIQYRN